MLDFMKNIIKAKVPVMAYYGDTDIVCNFLLGERFATQLGIKVFLYFKFKKYSFSY